jgi:hypothetical protein
MIVRVAAQRRGRCHKLFCCHYTTLNIYFVIICYSSVPVKIIPGSTKTEKVLHLLSELRNILYHCFHSLT